MCGSLVEFFGIGLIIAHFQSVEVHCFMKHILYSYNSGSYKLSFFKIWFGMLSIPVAFLNFSLLIAHFNFVWVNVLLSSTFPNWSSFNLSFNFFPFHFWTVGQIPWLDGLVCYITLWIHQSMFASPPLGPWLPPHLFSLHLLFAYSSVGLNYSSVPRNLYDLKYFLQYLLIVPISFSLIKFVGCSKE